MINKNDNEILDWTLFIDPMSDMLWLVIVFHAILLVFVFRLFWWYYDKTGLQQVSRTMRIFKIPQDFFVFFSSNLGRSYPIMKHEDKVTIKGLDSIVKGQLKKEYFSHIKN